MKGDEARPPFRLVKRHPSPDTVATLETLLAAAKSGNLIGLAFVAMYAGREYEASTVGEARRNPTFTRGMIRALDDTLAKALAR